jgi:3-hydroxyacyl-CoA dehydrogenase/enoyl-CoA hydratase/3-hydroxybutyryl-CoA epimerase
MSSETSHAVPEGLRHWQLEFGADGIAHLKIDKCESSTNVLSHEVLLELDRCLDAIADDARLTALIISSAKSSGFIYGADIAEFDQIDDAAAGTRLAAQGQSIISKIAALKIPSVAAIDGFALGGGLELALACTYRVAVESWDRRLGLPEVQLGIQPGFGGVVRSVGLLGPLSAMSLVLSGRLVSAVEAEKIGLVDRLSARDALLNAAKAILAERPAPQHPGLLSRLLNLRPLRPLVAIRLRQKLRERVNPAHYPAPFAIIDQWVAFGGRGEAALRAETESIGRLFLTPASRNLVRVFRLREKLRNLAPRSNAIERVHVIGAGAMGGDIAAWCALRGLEVTLQDQAPEAIEKALSRGERLFGKRLKAPGAAEAAAQRLTPDPDGSGAESADIVIEAVVERLDVKRQVFSKVERDAQADTILASNTSSLRLEDMAAELTHPHRLIGIHFFNPVAKMPLVEVIHGAASDDRTVERAIAFVTQIDKLPLPCRSAPGFLVNRVLTPYMFEALRAHLDGHSKEEIDAVAVDFGMPVGPIELADQVGLDVALHVAGIMRDTLGTEPPSMLAGMVENGRLGKKSGEGFYNWENGRARKAGWKGDIDASLQDRLILPLVNECVACLHEGIVESAELVDGGVIFATGFAPFRGGPIQYARARGIDDVIQALTALAARHGAHLAPKTGWEALR